MGTCDKETTLGSKKRFTVGQKINQHLKGFVGDSKWVTNQMFQVTSKVSSSQRVGSKQMSSL